MRYLSIGIIARDKFSLAASAVKSLVGELPSNSIIYLFDAGYPKPILDEVADLAASFDLPLIIVKTARFANTNHVWNQFVSIADSEYLMQLENDVTIGHDCIQNSLACLKDGRCDVAVPIVYENTKTEIGIPHFNPIKSDIRDLPDGGRVSILDRGRADIPPPAVPRLVKHLERHCFFMTTTSARRLGSLDEQMYCRTDYDMSIQCHAADLILKISNGSVTFFQCPDMKFDRDFFGYRWNIERVAFANARLISKWRLQGFKTTITHAFDARKFLEISK